MKTLIVYHSEHHGNTKKLLDAIADQEEVTLVEAGDASKIDASGYDLIGLASGIYYQKFHKDVLNWAEQNLPQGKKVFFLYTCGVKRNGYLDAIEQVVVSKASNIVGRYNCLGFDTFGPFKLVGGIAKGRPNEEDVTGFKEFFVGLHIG